MLSNCEGATVYIRDSIRVAIERGAVAGVIALQCVAGRTEQAQSADRFVDSIGVCTHWSYGDTPYGFAYERVKQRLVESGIRHVRDGLTPRISDLAKLGIHTTVVCEPDLGSPAEIRARVKAINADGLAIDAIEGPNEPDLFWARFKKSYRGQGYAQGDSGIIAGASAFQKDLYAAFKADSATAQIRVIGIALGKTYDPGGGHPNPLPPGSLTDAVDWGNFHPYPGGNPFSVPFPYAGIAKYLWQGNMPSGNIDEFPYAFNTYGPPYKPKPMAATETGYSTNRSGVSEAVHAKYMPRLFAEYFTKGVQRAYSYELIDEFEDKDGDNREAHFGLLRRDVSPKPAYSAVKNLIALLTDKGRAPFRPGSLDFTLKVTPPPGYDRVQYVHHLLLQKTDGDFYLLLWHEIADEDTSQTPHRQLTHPDMPVTITFSRPVRKAVRYAYDSDWTLKPTAQPIANNSVKVNVQDQIMALRLSPSR